MLRFLVTLIAVSMAVDAVAAARMADAYLYGYLGMEEVPLANVEILSVKRGSVRFRDRGRESEHSGSFSLIKVAHKKERKWWQVGSHQDDVVELVVLYGFMGTDMFPFPKASIIENEPGFIVFDLSGRRYTHSGRYEIHR